MSFAMLAVLQLYNEKIAAKRGEINNNALRYAKNSERRVEHHIYKILSTPLNSSLVI